MKPFDPRRLLRAWLNISEPSGDNAFLADSRPLIQPAVYQPNPLELIRESQRAWRENPLARRIISITTQYVIGKGVRFQASQPELQQFLESFWCHPLNRMELRIHEWCDELSRTGNLFMLVSSDPGGMSYVRLIPAAQVTEIEVRANDAEQPISFTIPTAGTHSVFETRVIPAADRLNPSLEPVMLHFSVNRMIGSLWGEPDLAPLLKWLSRFSNWLEDRARLNRYRNSFLFVVRSRLTSEAQRIQRQNQLNAVPPSPGSILVANESEEWSVLSPKLESSDAREDGLALKKMIAAGAGIPLHFLAEPESANKASAESAGESSCRHFEQRQIVFLKLIEEVLLQVAARAALVRTDLDPVQAINVWGDDISSRDNLRLSQASLNMIEVADQLKTLGLIDDDEARRIVYRFMGERSDLNQDKSL